MDCPLGLGKVSKEVFNRSVLPFLPLSNSPELDGATTELKGRTVIAHSPSIGVPVEALGFFSFHYAASNVAARFGQPEQLISGIYLPLRTPESELRTIAKSLGDEAKKYGVTVTAGQTATYYGLEIPLLTSTCIGTELRSPDTPRINDAVMILGKIGGEAVWLDKLSQGEPFDSWIEFTPLPSILALQSLDKVKMMHDVSEGGVAGSLFEITEAYDLGLECETGSLNVYDGAESVGNLLRAPTYGSLVLVVEPEGVSEVKSTCREIDTPCSVIGYVTEEKGLRIDGELIKKQKRVNLDEVYGAYDRSME